MTRPYKVIIIGESGVGKSCLLERQINARFNEALPFTGRSDWFPTATTIIADDGKNKVVHMMLWDTMGLERHNSIPSSLYRNPHGVLLCFDVTRRETFDRLKHWYDTSRQNLTFQNPNENPSYFVVGCKVDLARSVEESEAKTWAKTLNFPYVETSSKIGGVEETVFSPLAASMFAIFGDITPPVASKSVPEPTKESEPKKKCWC